MKSTKRVRREPAEAKNLILGAAEKLMLDEGYGAVSVRAVAKVAGLSSALVHYYFETTDDLLVMLYRRTSDRDMEYLKDALSADDPLMALWSYQTDAARTALGVEFLALANHRKVIRTEISRHAQRARRLQAKTLARFLDAADTGLTGCSPEGTSMLLTSVSRNLIMETAVGISLGHADARAYIIQALGKLRSRR